jgi:asparagine synthase (glutamine-hydrolysing)
VKYYKKHMNEAELSANFEDATWHCEHHNPDLNYVGKYALSEVPQGLGYKVVLTGEGADETYAGYPMYLSDYLREPDPSWPHTDLTDEERERKCSENDAEVIRYYKSIGADASTSEDDLPRRMLNGIMTVPSMTAFSASQLFAEWTSKYSANDPQLSIANGVSVQTLSKIQHHWHPLNSALYVWTKGHLANIFLSCLGDRTEMAHSIEARTPFLDHELTEYVYGLPPSLKIRWKKEQGRFVEKWVLREAAKPFITRELYERKKHVCAMLGITGIGSANVDVQPYSAPTMFPSGGPLHKLLAKLLARENVEQLGFVGAKKTSTLVEDAFENKKPLAMRLALVVAQWVVLANRFGVKTAVSPA